MSSIDELEGVDFRPFFDMIVGILFVLLILIGALIFFQQSQAQTDATMQSRQDELRRRRQADEFLDGIAIALASRGIPAQADYAAGAVLVPLSAVAEADAPGFVPFPREEALAALGAAMIGPVGCVSFPRRPSPACPEPDLLDLVSMQVETRMGHLPAGAAITQGEASRLTGALVASGLLNRSLPLLRATEAEGGRLLSFGSGLSTADPSATAPLAGEIAIGFTFSSPGR